MGSGVVGDRGVDHPTGIPPPLPATVGVGPGWDPRGFPGGYGGGSRVGSDRGYLRGVKLICTGVFPGSGGLGHTYLYATGAEGIVPNPGGW